MVRLGNKCCLYELMTHQPSPLSHIRSVLSEPHLITLDFQNYLRTQTGNTTTINIIICTVDYLLRLQVRRVVVQV